MLVLLWLPAVFASMPAAATIAPERTLQRKGHGDGVAKGSRKRHIFSRFQSNFPEAGIDQLPSLAPSTLSCAGGLVLAGGL